LQKYRRALITIPIILIVLVVLPFLIPMSAYVSQAEQAASGALGVPVKIGGLRVALLPTPRLNVSDVVVGSNEDFTVEDVAVVPAIFSMFSEVKTISSLKVKRPVIKQSALEIVSALGKADAAKSELASVTIREISISKAQLVWPDMALPEFNVDVVMTDDNKPESAQIATTDGKVKIDLVPEDDRQRITMSARNWTLPVGVPLLIDRLDSEMMLVDKRLDIQRLDIELYEGKVSTDAVLTLQKNWSLEGKLNVAGVQLAGPVSMVSQSTQLSGKLSGDGSYKASAKEPEKLMEQLQANFKFKVLDGVLDGVDLAKAATLLGTKGGMDGQTRFDTLTGMLNVAGKQYHLRNLDIVSGLLKATGDVKIKPNKELGGEVKVEIKKGTTLVAIPLQVTGTTEKPMVLPTKAALAGAAAGTAILGPGVGTSLGIQAADKLKGLFGSDED
jgi:uncharacterized protein involved in outer membrane biogenesis